MSYLLQDDIAYLGVYVIFQGRRYNGLKFCYKIIKEGIVYFCIMEERHYTYIWVL